MREEVQSRPRDRWNPARELSDWRQLLSNRARLESRLAVLHVDAESHRLARVTLEELVAILAQRVLELVEADAFGRLAAFLLQFHELLVDALPLGRLVLDGRRAAGVAISRELTENFARNLAHHRLLVVLVGLEGGARRRSGAPASPERNGAGNVRRSARCRNGSRRRSCTDRGSRWI